MGKNIVRKIIEGTGTFGVPAGVKNLLVFKKTVEIAGIDAFAGGGGAGLALKADGTMWTWGENADGQLGDASVTSRSTPVQVVGGHKFVKVGGGGTNSGGDFVNAAIKEDGTIWTMGSNGSGQLGDGTTTPKSSPVAVVGGHTFADFRASGFFVVALKADGSAWTWGEGGNGVLGDNTATGKSSPVPVVGSHSFIAVATTSGFSASGSCAGLKADGTVWTWGTNDDGQLGDGTVTDRSSPVQVLGTNSFVAIAGGGRSFFGLQADGTTWSWGWNGAGQLGDGSVVPKSSPVAVIGGHSFVAIAAGNGAAYGLKSDGTMWSWGHNIQASLGDGTTTTKSSPVAVVGGHSFIAIAAAGGNSIAGGSSAFGLKEDGTLWAFGYNASGELGDGSTTTRSSPVPVAGGNVFSGLQGTAEFYFMQVTPGQQIGYGPSVFGPIRTDGPFVVQYEA